MYLHLGKTASKMKYFVSFLLVLAGIELTLFAVARTGLCLRFVLETMLTTQRWFSYCWAGLAQHEGQGTKGIFQTTAHHVQKQKWGRLVWGLCSGTGNCFLLHHLSFFIIYLTLLFSFFLELIFQHPVIKLFLYQPMRFFTFTLWFSPHPMGQEAE